MNGRHAEGPPRRAALGTVARAGNVVEQDSTGQRLDEQQTFDEYRRQLAERARDAGLDAAEHADREWLERAGDWIRVRPRGRIFDADDLRQELGTSMAAGSVFRRASRDGLIEVVGVSTSRAASRHRGIARRWRRT